MTMSQMRLFLLPLLLLVVPLANGQRIRNNPNVIVVQADDLPFLESWAGTHPHFDNSHRVTSPNAADIPNIEYLRQNGLQLLQAHTASPMCGTSRYSTISARYPSRSAKGREWDSGASMREITIPNTKLLDSNQVNKGQDCSRNNIAQNFQSGGYRTGMVGKWHLSFWDTFNYPQLQNTVRNCGFDEAEAVYPHNMEGEWATSYGYQIDHNMEHVAAEAIQFIQGAVNRDENFFLYLNPTVPHGSSDVSGTLQNRDCRESVAGYINTPNIPRGKYSQLVSGDCSTYRQNVLSRAGSWNDKELGFIWLDDAMGWIMEELKHHGIFDNTVILFQQDHGQEGKGTLYDQGVHIAQFVHYPDKYRPGSTFDGLVSTIDIGPTMLQITGISPNYEMDGKSWANAAISQNQATLNSWRNRCIFYELNHDRAVQCGCDVYMRLSTTHDSWTRRLHLIYTASQPTLNAGEDQLFNMCNNGNFIYSPAPQNPQRNGKLLLGSNKVNQLSALVDCHLAKTRPGRSPDYTTECTSGPPLLSPAPPSPSPPSPGNCQNAGQFRAKNGSTRTCQWVASRKNQLCSVYGDRCPVTCGRCPAQPSPSPPSPTPPSPSPPSPSPPGQCMDRTDRFRASNGQLRRCQWVAARRQQRCQVFDEECPKTCGKC